MKWFCLIKHAQHPNTKSLLQHATMEWTQVYKLQYLYNYWSLACRTSLKLWFLLFNFLRQFSLWTDFSFSRTTTTTIGRRLANHWTLDARRPLLSHTSLHSWPSLSLLLLFSFTKPSFHFFLYQSTEYLFPTTLYVFHSFFLFASRSTYLLSNRYLCR